MHTLGDFKGNPTITLQETEDSKYPFTFGLNKARLILKELDAIKEFVDAHRKPDEKPIDDQSQIPF